MQYPIKPRLSKRVTPLHIHCGTSRRLQLLVLGICLFAACMLLLLIALHSAWFVAGTPVPVLYATWFYRLHITRTGHQAVTDLYRRSDGSWQIQCQSGQIEQAELLGDSVVLPGMMILKLRRPGTWKTRTVVLMPDALGENKYRRICVQLLTGKAVTTTG